MEYLCSNKVLGNPNLNKKIKETVLDMLYSTAEFHKALFNKNQALLKRVVEAICGIISQPFTEEDIEDGEEPL